MVWEKQRLWQLRSVDQRQVGRQQGPPIRRDSPNATVCFVSRRISVSVVLMTGDRVVPVNDVNRPVRAEFDIDWAKIAMTGSKQRFLPFERETGAVILNGESANAVGLVVTDHEIAVK